MPFRFSYVCALLQALYEDLSKKSGQEGPHKIIRDWFRQHRQDLDCRDADYSPSALLSTLLPDQRSDRVYCIQETTLQREIGRAQHMCVNRSRELARWREEGSGVDLADCVESTFSCTPVRRHRGSRGAKLWANVAYRCRRNRVTT
jgi:DNA ligase 4